MTFVLAHKGETQSCPENTMPAFEECMRLGVDGFETDIHITSDGVPVISHGYTINAYSDGEGCINDMTLAELKKYDFGSWKGEAFKGTGICTLEECLNRFADRGIVGLDIKTPLRMNLDLEGAVSEVVGRCPKKENVIISSFDHSSLNKIRDIDDTLNLGAIMLPAFSELEDLLDIISECYPSDIPLDSLKPEDVTPFEDGTIIDDWLGVHGMDMTELYMDVAHILGSMYPGETFQVVGRLIGQQANIPEYIKTLDSDPEYVLCHYISPMMESDLASKLHEQKKTVVAWGVSSKEGIDRMFSEGADGVISDYCEKIA